LAEEEKPNKIERGEVQLVGPEDDDTEHAPSMGDIVVVRNYSNQF
jgi:hypothetical protein